jgi:hypothetical protein
MIPAKPTDTSPQGWIEWVLTHYPYSREHELWAKRRSPRDVPTFGTLESLEDLRIIPNDNASSLLLAAYVAALWFSTYENMERVLKFHGARRKDEAELERRRLCNLARQALDGKLGENGQERDDAKTTAQAYLKRSPEYCSDDELSDWLTMHQHARKVARGWRGPLPKLSSDRRRESQQRNELNQIDDAIGAEPANRPRYEQRGLYG